MKWITIIIFDWPQIWTQARLAKNNKLKCIWESVISEHFFWESHTITPIFSAIFGNIMLCNFWHFEQIRRDSVPLIRQQALAVDQYDFFIWLCFFPVGILVVEKPCSIVVDVKELFGSESKSQVYAHLHNLLEKPSMQGTSKWFYLFHKTSDAKLKSHC